MKERDQLQQRLNLLVEQHRMEKEAFQKKISSVQRELVFARQKTEDITHAIAEWSAMKNAAKQEGKGGKR